MRESAEEKKGIFPGFEIKLGGKYGRKKEGNFYSRNGADKSRLKLHQARMRKPAAEKKIFGKNGFVRPYQKFFREKFFSLALPPPPENFQIFFWSLD